MTKLEIKHWMINRINETLESQLDEETLLEEISEDDLNDYMWGKDYGQSIVDEYIEDAKETLIEALLDTIYDDINYTDLDTPW